MWTQKFKIFPLQVLNIPYFIVGMFVIGALYIFLTIIITFFGLCFPGGCFAWGLISSIYTFYILLETKLIMCKGEEFFKND